MRPLCRGGTKFDAGVLQICRNRYPHSVGFAAGAISFALCRGRRGSPPRRSALWGSCRTAVILFQTAFDLLPEAHTAHGDDLPPQLPDLPGLLLLRLGRVLLLVTLEPGQIPPVRRRMHVTGRRRGPLGEATGAIREKQGPQTLFRIGHPFTVVIQGAAASLLLATVIEPGILAAEESAAGIVQVPHPLAAGRAEEKQLTTAEPVRLP